jgi:hypothetical protein
MASILRRTHGRRVLLHDSIQIRQLGDLPINFSAVIIVIGQCIMYLGRVQLRELVQDLFNGQAATVILYDGTDWKPTVLNDRSPALHVRAALDVGMNHFSGYGLGTHKKLLLNAIQSRLTCKCQQGKGIRLSVYTEKKRTPSSLDSAQS